MNISVITQFDLIENLDIDTRKNNLNEISKSIREYLEESMYDLNDLYPNLDNDVKIEVNHMSTQDLISDVNLTFSIHLSGNSLIIFDEEREKLEFKSFIKNTLDEIHRLWNKYHQGFSHQIFDEKIIDVRFN